MTEFFNFHDSFFVLSGNWFWVLLALGLGVWVGWSTNVPDKA